MSTPHTTPTDAQAAAGVPLSNELLNVLLQSLDKDGTWVTALYLKHHITAQAATIERLTEALAWYADTDNGDRARRVLDCVRYTMTDPARTTQEEQEAE